MTPYSAERCEGKIREYKNFIKEQKLNNISVSYGEVPKITEGYMYKRRKKLNETPIELKQDDKIVMELSVKEVQATIEIIKRAKGVCGILGLGLGFCVEEIAKKDEVKEVIVYEKNTDIIKIYENNFGKNSKIKIINCDGFKADRKTFDFFFADIYSYQINEKIALDYEILTTIHDIEKYSFFGIEHFLLSCPMEKLAWVYIPEEWMDMSKRVYDNLDKIGQVKNIRKVKASNVTKLLEEFREIL